MVESAQNRAMTAHDLISSIFSHVQNRVAGNVRMITRPQLYLLRALIAEDRESYAVRSDGPGVTVWEPSGLDKYVITEDLYGDRHRLERVANHIASDAGWLF